MKSHQTHNQPLLKGLLLLVLALNFSWGETQKEAGSTDLAQTSADKPTSDTLTFEKENVCEIQHDIVLTKIDEKHTEVTLKKSSCDDCLIFKYQEDRSFSEVIRQKDEVFDVVRAVLMSKEEYRSKCKNKEDKKAEEEKKKESEEEKKRIAEGLERCELDKHGDRLDTRGQLECNIDKLDKLDDPIVDEKGKKRYKSGSVVMREAEELIRTKIRPGIKKALKEDYEDGAELIDEVQDKIENLAINADMEDDRSGRLLQSKVAKMHNEFNSLKTAGDFYHRSKDKKQQVDELKANFMDAYTAQKAGDPWAFDRINELTHAHMGLVNQMSMEFSMPLRLLNNFKSRGFLSTSDATEFMQPYDLMQADLINMLDANKIGLPASIGPVFTNPVNSGLSGGLLTPDLFSARIGNGSAMMRSHGIHPSLLTTRPTTSIDWNTALGSYPVGSVSSMGTASGPSGMSAARMGRIGPY